ncbi:MAG: lipopolysaccharide biosynthesis protein [Campylobacter sp.]|nr:lipopolysaccharide biosynthesis protein [Campylobacter sp.]
MQENIIQKTKIGFFWNALEKFGVQIVNFVLTIILVRLLSPSDFGTMAFLSVFISISNIFTEGGFLRALIQKRDCNEHDFSTVFIFNIIVGTGFYIILFFLAPFISQFYEIDSLTQIQRVIFLIIIFQALCVVQIAKFQLNINFKTLAFLNLTSIIFSGLLGVFLAYKGFGIWALVWREIIRSILMVVLYWYFSGWIPKTGFSKASFKRLFSYGSKLIGVGLIAIVVNGIYNMYIGKMYSTKELGYFSQGEHYPGLVSLIFVNILTTVTFPLMSYLQDDKSKLMEIFKRLIKINAIIILPVMFYFAFLSEEFVLTFLGEKWIMVADLLFWFALSYIFTPFSALNLNILNAVGRSDLFLKIEFIKLPIIFTTMLITFPISLKAIVIGRFISTFLSFFINTYICHKNYDFGALSQIWHIKNIIFAVLVMVISISICKFFITNAILCLILSAIIGSITYFFMLKIVKEEELEFVMIKLKNKFKRK